MRPKLREQLRRQKARPRSSNRFWSQVSGIEVPWTKGQRVWMRAKIKEQIDSAFRSIATTPKPDTIIMSSEAFDLYKSALMNQEVN